MLHYDWYNRVFMTLKYELIKHFNDTNRPELSIWVKENLDIQRSMMDRHPRITLFDIQKKEEILTLYYDSHNHHFFVYASDSLQFNIYHDQMLMMLITEALDIYISGAHENGMVLDPDHLFNIEPHGTHYHQSNRCQNHVTNSLNLNNAHLEINDWFHCLDRRGSLTIDTDIRIIDLTSEQEKVIGFINLRLFDKFWNDIVEAAEEHDEDTRILVKKIVQLENNKLNSFQRLGIIECIFVEKEFRGYGIGTSALKQAYWYLNDVMRADVICLTARPFEGNIMEGVETLEDEYRKKRLIKWYKEQGFYPVISWEEQHFYVDARLYRPRSVY